MSHYLRANETVWSPRHVCFFDTETFPTAAEGSEVLGMRLWVGGIVDRRPRNGAKVSVRTAHGADRRSLATWLNQSAVGRPTLWCFAHNLGFDLTVSRLPDEMHRLGWSMTEWQFAGRNVTGRMGKGSKRLTLVDSTSWLPHTLEQVGLAVGRPKLAMPAMDAAEEDWLDYCTGDVLVLAESVLTLLDWWDREELGHWSLSGPACGWNSARHRGPKRLFLIKTEPEGVAHDRSAIRGGRRDVTRVGEIPGGPFALVDFSSAYLSVCATQLLPKGRLGHYPSFDPESIWVDGNRFGVVAECEVDTTVPRYPLRTARGVFYPVGRFRTVLASPEIIEARDRGELRDIGPGYVHDLGYPLAGWARWCLSLEDPANTEVPAVVRMMVHQWGRSVVGKFAARSSQTTDMGPALWPGWHLERGTSGTDHSPAADVHIAGRHWWVTHDVEGENAYPAVLAWVESYVRVALGRMLDQLGEDLWVTCDTDGATLDLTKARSWLAERKIPLGRTRSPLTVAEAVCGHLAAFTAPLVPRVKMLSETLSVAGPQHYAGNTFERAAGRPGKPEVDDQGVLHWWRWPKVAWQMSHGSADGFVRVEGKWTSPSQLAHRWVLDDGTAVPVEASSLPDGRTRLHEWPFLAAYHYPMRLGPEQAPALRGLW